MRHILRIIICMLARMLMIMFQESTFRFKNEFKALLSIVLFSVFTVNVHAEKNNNFLFTKSISYNFFFAADTVVLPLTDTLRTDTLLHTLPRDSNSVQVDSSLFSKDSLSSPITYSAKDSFTFLVQQKQLYLYGNANANSKGTSAQESVDITANTIFYDNATNIVRAWGGTDSSKNALNLPTIVQGDSKSIMDTIAFNLKTQKGIFKNTYYNEGEIFVNAEIVKKVDKDVAFAYNGRFTTCNLDEPHFALRAKRLKLITNKLAVSGPAFPEFESVPMPVMIPFGIYPLQRGRHSGLIPPQFTQNASMGLGLEGLGYYYVINDYWDVTLRGNIYSYFGYNISASPQYYKRYRYRGRFSLNFQKTQTLNESPLIEDMFIKSKSFQINWSHSMDSKARPGVSFSASVNAGSSRYNENIPNNPYKNFQNQMSSSISYSKSWQEGKYNLSLQANHNQNNSTRLVNVQLPTLSFSTKTFNPFLNTESIGTPKWYQNFGIGYNGTLLNQFSFYDTAFTFRHLADTIQWGAQHNIPITLSLPSLGPIMLSPSISYSENWMSRKIHRQWNEQTQLVDTTITRGFFAARQMSFGMSANTRIFGTFNFNRGKFIALRHEIRPSISANYTPNMARGYHELIRYDTAQNAIRWVSQYEGNLFGGFSNVAFGGLNFGIDNLLELKVRNSKDTTGEVENQTKKIRLIDGLSITSGYNFLADSLQWQPVNISMRTSLFENKLSVTSNASIDQYERDPATGQRINQLLWKRGNLGSLTNANIALSTSFSSKKKDERKDQDRIPIDPSLTMDEQQRQIEYIRQNASDFVDFNIPWNISTSLSLNYYKQMKSNYRGYDNIFNASLNLSGDFSLTPKWKAGGSTYFDLKTMKMQMLTVFLSREMHCWQLSINITPVGPWKSFSVILNPKSGILRDLKINRSRSFGN